MKDADQATELFDDIYLIPNNTEELLNERQYLDYRSEREHCLDWLLTAEPSVRLIDENTVSNIERWWYRSPSMRALWA